MDSDKIYEEIKNLYDQKKEITLMKEYYLNELQKIKEVTYNLENDYYPLLKKYQMNKVISFLTFILAFYANNTIDNKINKNFISGNQKIILETIELIIYIIPFIGTINNYFNDLPLKEEIRNRKQELKNYYMTIKKYKCLLKILDNTNRELQEIIVSKNYFISYVNKNNIKMMSK